MTNTKTNRALNPAASENDKAEQTQTSNDYINHTLSGITIFYIYRISTWTDEETGEITHFFKANMKTGAKKGDTYIPCEGTLSPYAVQELDGIFDLVNSEDESIRRTAGVTVSAARFEGSNAFIKNEDKQAVKAGDKSIDDVKPVSVSKFRIHKVLGMKLFKKKQTEDSQAASPVKAMHEQVEKIRATG